MPKPPDTAHLPFDTLAGIFPFYLLVSGEPIPRLLAAGDAIGKVLTEDFAGHALFEEFELKRPRLKELSAESLRKHTKSLVMLQHRDSSVTLRGQFVSTSNDSLLFLGSLLVSAADSLQASGFTLQDFAAFDNAPELLILHKFRDMQISDLERKKVELNKTIESRDTYNRAANTDSLTGIPNRRGFLQRCAEMLEQPKPDQLIVVLLLDLDGFKHINDTFGHEAGDQVLITTAQRFSEQTEGMGYAGRLGGDEFASILNFEETSQIQPFTETLQNSLSLPIEYQRSLLTTKVSIGLALANHTDDTQSLMHKADMAMYAGRSCRKGQIFWYTAKLQLALDKRKALEAAFETAIANREIEAVFQPIINLSDYSLTSLETLARWHHPDLGTVPPLEFIQLAEDLGLLQQFDWLMLETAIDQLGIWHRSGHEHSLHINLSPPTLTTELPERLNSLLRKWSLAPEKVILELTETSLLRSSEQTVRVLQQLSDWGVGLQLDDFGTGYSALTHLLQFPVDGIKLDRSYIHAATRSDRAQRLLLALIDLGQTLGITIVAEGVETREQLHMLISAGCDYGQGYLLGRPLPANEVLSEYDVMKIAA